MSTRDVVVAGVGMHPWGKWGRNFVEYGLHAARTALDDAGVDWRDVQYVVGGVVGVVELGQDRDRLAGELDRHDGRGLVRVGGDVRRRWRVVVGRPRPHRAGPGQRDGVELVGPACRVRAGGRAGREHRGTARRAPLPQQGRRVGREPALHDGRGERVGHGWRPRVEI